MRNYDVYGANQNTPAATRNTCNWPSLRKEKPQQKHRSKSLALILPVREE
jgi:hypothetical protein